MTIQQYAKYLAVEDKEIKKRWIINKMLEMLPPKFHHFFTILAIMLMMQIRI